MENRAKAQLKSDSDRLKLRELGLTPILANESLANKFKEQLHREFDVENLLFYIAAQEFEEMAEYSYDRDNVWKKVEQIYDTFIAVGSKNEINISCDQRKFITEAIAARDDVKCGQIFRNSKDELQKMIQQGSLMRFISEMKDE
eukprot:887705_1